MIHTETKFAYRHKPTGKWVYIYLSHHTKPKLYMLFRDDFHTEILYSARNIIEEDLFSSIDCDQHYGEKYAAQNFLEFELVEIKIEYKIKQEYVEIKIHESLTGWPN